MKQLKNFLWGRSEKEYWEDFHKEHKETFDIAMASSVYMNQHPEYFSKLKKIFTSEVDHKKIIFYGIKVKKDIHDSISKYDIEGNLIKTYEVVLTNKKPPKKTKLVQMGSINGKDGMLGK